MTPIQHKKRGPEAERVKIEGMDWQAAVGKALQKPAPAKGKKRASGTTKKKR